MSSSDTALVHFLLALVRSRTQKPFSDACLMLFNVADLDTLESNQNKSESKVKKFIHLKTIHPSAKTF